MYNASINKKTSEEVFYTAYAWLGRRDVIQLFNVDDNISSVVNHSELHN